VECRKPHLADADDVLRINRQARRKIAKTRHGTLAHAEYGMIAYDWLRRRLQPSDCLFTEGFTFEVWHGHPWAIEKQLIKPIMAMDGQDKPRHGAVSSQV
jgi:hypothetical protein